MKKEDFFKEALPDSIGPLKGVKVLEATHYGAGPAVGTLLTDMGAESIKCDSPGTGDTLRHLPPFLEDKESGTKESMYHLVINRGKKNITLNFKEPEGQEIFKELAKKVDVVIENYKPGTMEKWNLGYQDIRKVKPDIIYTSASGYGQFGPYAQRPGFDTVGQAYGGLMHVTGFPDGPPIRTGNAMSDNITGWLGAYSTVCALYYRDKTGKGQHIDIGQVDVILYTSEIGILGAATGKFHWNRIGCGHPSAVVCDQYHCKDGYVYIIAHQPSHWSKFCKIIGREDLIEDPRTNTPETRGKNRSFVDEVVGSWVKDKKVEEVVELLNDAQLVVMPILNFPQIVENEHVHARDMIVEVDHPTLGKLPIYGVGPKFSLTPGKIRSAAPLLGQHNEEIYQDLLGFNQEKTAQLKQRGII
jgi:crotonobetainyl-CoA:carnitine CoA-transferase CaiB-like acyl-CoA transferase